MVDYDYYVNCYLGCQIPQKEFSSLARRAADYLDRMKRTWLVVGGEDATAMALCAMAEELHRDRRRRGVVSASIGGVQVQYREEADRRLLQQLYRCAAIYLDIYRGRCGYESR